ncbi:hypothetical protein LTR66_008343 [Elasticomyces elasticus]|nr:hypothetical protein LTR66_008343 [Elasticomyces elasticus]
MPQLFPLAGHGHAYDMQDTGDQALLEPLSKQRIWRRLSLSRIGHWLKREDEDVPPVPNMWDQHGHHAQGYEQEQERQEQEQEQETHSAERRPLRGPSILGRRLSRKVVPELPRPQTFRRQNSEKRDRLEPVEPSPWGKRAVSADRRQGASFRRVRSPPHIPVPSLWVPEAGTPDHEAALSPAEEQANTTSGEDARVPRDVQGELPPPLSPNAPEIDRDDSDSDADQLSNRELQEELDAKWILNLSMHFRDKSDREKFFVTYAEQPNKWRRVTVSCDYRNARPDSLEADLRSLHYQRDKSLRIYESIRDSLPDIQFYNTVTNLKLETDDGRLHVHVMEDVNENITYPSVSTVAHLECPHIRESDLDFVSHLSGFVYKVRAQDHVDMRNPTLIKKEIPGPDTVEEFLYELNALHALRDADSVIQLQGLIVSDDGSLVKGLLISHAAQGALVDVLYDHKDTDRLPWSRRERWAKQIMQGLSEIHEAGFVQGDFTLSNIVIDAWDNAKIIDINRRGCPVGWEPPELGRLIESGQRISMHIGVKSDLFQLGMVLWALAEVVDEPERRERPLPKISNPDAPAYFRNLVDSCLSVRPQERKSAKQLLGMFETARTHERDASPLVELDESKYSVSTHRSDKEYIDPSLAVDRDDIDSCRRQRSNTGGSHLTSDQVTYPDDPSSTDYRLDSSGSYVVDRRGRSSNTDRRRRSSPYARPVSSATSLSARSSRDPRWEHVYRDEDHTAFSDTASHGEEDLCPDTRQRQRSPVLRDTASANEGIDVQSAHHQLSRKTSHELMPPLPLPSAQQGNSIQARDPLSGPVVCFDDLGHARLDATDLLSHSQRQGTLELGPLPHQDYASDELIGRFPDLLHPQSSPDVDLHPGYSERDRT